MCRTCCHSPWMQTVSGVNAVATPTGAPTGPPWAASSASDARSPQCSGASPPGRSGPQASTSPPPVTRHPLGGGAARQTWASVAVTVRPVAPTTSHVTDTSSHALPVRPLTLPVADAIAPGSSDAMAAGVVGTGVPAPVGGQVGSFVKMLSVIAQFASATPPVFVTLNVIWFTPFASCATHTFSIFTLGTSQTALSVAVIFFCWEGLAGSTDPTTSHVTEAVLHAFVVSPLTLPFTVVLIPCGSDATPGTVTGVDAPVGGQVGSFLNTLSLTTQFARSAVPVFISSMSTSLLPLASGTRQGLVTFSPGVRHWNFAMSFAVARKFAFLSAVQKQLTVAVSGSLALSSALHVLSISAAVDTVTTSPRVTAVLLRTVLVSVTVQLKRAVPPVLLAM